jgi:hypothetical protein
MSSIAADGLRAAGAAWRIELPPSTARTILLPEIRAEHLARFGC